MFDPKIAVIIHAHHLDILEEILYHLENIPGDFDLFLNFSFIDEKNKQYVSRLKKFLTQNIPGKCYFTVSHNRGQDLGGFFASTQVARDENLSYDLVCKLHTKKNEDKWLETFQTTRTTWRKRLLKTLVGSTDQIMTIFNIFKTHPNVGMVSDEKFYCSAWQPKNMPSYAYFSKKLNLKGDVGWTENTKFLAGTMFWFRGELWDFIKDSPINIKDFEIGVASDGLRAHAFERIFEALVWHLNYTPWLIKSGRGL